MSFEGFIENLTPSFASYLFCFVKVKVVLYTLTMTLTVERFTVSSVEGSLFSARFQFESVCIAHHRLIHEVYLTQTFRAASMLVQSW